MIKDLTRTPAAVTAIRHHPSRPYAKVLVIDKDDGYLTRWPFGGRLSGDPVE
ncbi:MAG: hypothetical protein QOE54_4183 [Streptosporangiaceae bacterium]|nr:hypothetical protein [Streptosporangiaceae bacterium]